MDVSKNVEVARGGFDDIQPELTDLVYSSLFPTILIGSSGLIGATALMAYVYRDAILWTIVGLAVLVSSARVALALAYRRRNPTEVLSLEDARRWELFYSAATIVYTSLLAVVTVLVFAKHDLPGSFLCAVGSVTVCGGLASRLGLRPLLMKISGLVPLVTLFLSAVIFGQFLVIVGGVMAALYSLTFIESASRNFDIVVEQLRAKRAVTLSAEQDALTQLPNRRKLRSRLVELCKANTSFAVLFLDLDDFKPVNDTLGHAGGDELLLQVAGRLRSMMRDTDLLARIGGDEFAIIQSPTSTKREVVALAERINQQIAAPYRIHGEKAVIGVSVGVRLAIGGVHEPDDLLHNADRALYNVKSAGKGGFSVAVD